MRVLAGFLSLLLIPAVGGAQCPVDSSDTSEIHEHFEQRDWAGAVLLASPMTGRSADEDFELGIALARMQQWPQARAALMEGERACPLQKRFDIELAGIAFERKLYPEAAAWVGRRVEAGRERRISNDFAGTVYLLMGNINAALKYWNRIGKPYVNAIEFDPQLRVQRLVLRPCFAFSPAAVLAEREFGSTEARVNGLGIFARHKLTLETRQDGKFDAKFEAAERDGFGSSWAAGPGIRRLAAQPTRNLTAIQLLLNIGGSAMNFESLFRFDAQKRRFGSPLRTASWAAGAALAIAGGWPQRRLGDTGLLYRHGPGAGFAEPGARGGCGVDHEFLERAGAMVDGSRAFPSQLSQRGGRNGIAAGAGGSSL